MGNQVGMSGCRVRPLMQNFHSTPIGTATACHDERLYSCKCLPSNIKIQRTGPRILSNRNRFCPLLILSVRLIQKSMSNGKHTNAMRGGPCFPLIAGQRATG